MPRPVVTVDFHNTLIECDSWFTLEIRTLAGRVLDWAIENGYRGPVQVNRKRVEDEYRRLRLAIHLHGHELNAERSCRVVLDRLGIELPDTVIEQAVSALMREALIDSRPIAGAQIFIAGLEAAEAGIAIVSSAVYHPFLEWALEQHSMRYAITEIVTSASCGYYKSRPEIFWHALDSLGAERGTGVHIGDSLRFDVGGAGAAGMRTAWYAPDGAWARAFPDIVPDLTVRDLSGAASAVLDLASRQTSAASASHPGLST